jgi:hypothetical protein
MNRRQLAGPCVVLWLCGCSTLTGDFHQKLQIDALDAQSHRVDGMRCQVGSGTSANTFVTPATEVRVRRGFEPLAIECRRDNLIATATVKSRRERMEEALLPFGSVGVFVDHLSGSLYSYPTALHLRVGQHLVLEHGGEAQVVKAEPIAAPPQAGSAPAQRIVVAAVQPAAIATAASIQAAAPAPLRAAAPAPHKTAAAAPKTDRAAARPVKIAGAAAVATKPRVATPAGVAPAGSAPSNR